MAAACAGSASGRRVYALLVRFYTAVPLLDDYWHLIAFALEWQSTAGAGARAGLLLHTQVGPYKLIFDHALIALQLGLFGRLNFPLTILLGNLTLLGISRCSGRTHRVRWGAATVSRARAGEPVALQPELRGDGELGEAVRERIYTPPLPEHFALP